MGSARRDTNHESDAQQLEQDLESDNSNVRAAAAKALGSMGEDAVSALPALSEVLQNDEQHQVRYYAVKSLNTLTRRLAPEVTVIAVPRLVHALRDSNLIRFEAAEALGNIGPKAEAAVPVLAEMLKDDNKYFRAKVEQALRRIQTDK